MSRSFLCQMLCNARKKAKLKRLHTEKLKADNRFTYEDDAV